nr:hypothetical protein GCM10020092_041250 [Actinoplanes digitatis]
MGDSGNRQNARTRRGRRGAPDIPATGPDAAIRVYPVLSPPAALIIDAGPGEDKNGRMTIPRPPAPWLIRPVKLLTTTPPPLTGPWAPADTRLDDVELLTVPGHGPEDVAVGPEGHVYSGTEDGRIWRWQPDAHAGAVPEPLADTGG